MPVVRKVYKPSPSHQKFIDILTEKNRPKKVANLMDEYLGDQREYQKAVDDGFQGTYEEFLRMKSMRENAAYGGRMGYSLAGLAVDIGTAGIKKAVPFVKQKLNQIKPYEGSKKGIGVSNPKGDVTPEREFADAFLQLKNKYFGENFSAAARALGQSREKIKGIFDRLRLRDTGTRVGADVGKSPRMQSTISVAEDAMPYTDVTTLMKQNPEVFKKLLKSKDEYLNQESLGHYLKMMFEKSPSGIKTKLGKTQYDAFGNRLRNLEVKSKTNPGGEITYSVNNAIKEMLEASKNKLVKGQRKNKFLARNEKEVDPELYTFRSNLKRRVADLSKEEDIFLPNAIDDVGHSFSLVESKKFKNLFKDSNINKLNTLVYQDPLLNRDLFKATGYEKKYVSMFKELEELRNKPVTIETQKKLLEIKKKMNDNYNYIIDIVSNPQKIKSTLNKNDKKINDSYAKYISNQADRIQKIDINIPKVGEKFKSKDLFVDMSNVNPKYIMGYVDKINPNAKKLKDLSMSERAIFEANAKSQNADIVADFYKKARFGKEPVEEVRERISYDFAKGGIVDVIPRKNLGRGYLAGGIRSLGNRYRDSTLEAILENPKLMGTEIGYDVLNEIFRLLGLYSVGGHVKKNDE
jgi:hypothetical protein